MSSDLRRRPRPVRPARGPSPIKITLAVVGTAVALFLLFGVGAAVWTYGEREEPAAATASTKAKVKAGPGLGDAVRDGKLEFVISRVDCAQRTLGAEQLKRTASGRFCVVSMTVRDIGDGAKYFVGHAQKAYDAAGTEYGADELAGVYANRGTEGFLRRIGPGEKVAGKLVFDVPKGVKLTTIKVHDSPLSGGAAVTIG